MCLPGIEQSIWWSPTGCSWKTIRDTEKKKKKVIQKSKKTKYRNREIPKYIWGHEQSIWWSRAGCFWKTIKNTGKRSKEKLNTEIKNTKYINTEIPKYIWGHEQSIWWSRAGCSWKTIKGGWMDVGQLCYTASPYLSCLGQTNSLPGGIGWDGVERQLGTSIATQAQHPIIVNMGSFLSLKSSS